MTRSARLFSGFLVFHARGFYGGSSVFLWTAVTAVVLEPAQRNDSQESERTCHLALRALCGGKPKHENSVRPYGDYGQVPRLGFVLCWLLRSFHPKISLGFLLSPALAHVSTWDGSRRLGLRFLSDTMRERNLEAVSRLFLTQPGRREEALQGTSVGSSARLRSCLVPQRGEGEDFFSYQPGSIVHLAGQKGKRSRTVSSRFQPTFGKLDVANCMQLPVWVSLVWGGAGMSQLRIPCRGIVETSHAPPSRQCLRTYGWGRKPERLREPPTAAGEMGDRCSFQVAGIEA
jgi:hypothetical protein